MTQLKILCDTVLKQQPVQSSKLPDNQKQGVTGGTVFNIQSFAPVGDHIKVSLLGQSFQGKNTWFVYQRHAAILENGKVRFPASVKLTVPYFDQLDNSENPYGSCNVTSISMCLAYLGAKRNNPSQRFPDELQDFCAANGLDRHAPDVLAKIVQTYGFKDTFRTDASFEDVKQWLIQGNPAVVHGYFTPSGHVIAIIGYSQQGFIVNDPYGELMYSPLKSYYDTYASGAGLTYSYNLMYNTCCTDNQFWVHFISR
jgi:uncharacterized protein YvpB